MKQDILAVDKRRKKYYGQFTGQEWGSKENFDLCINMAGMNIKGIIPGLAEQSILEQ